MTRFKSKSRFNKLVFLRTFINGRNNIRVVFIKILLFEIQAFK